jgi:ribosomal-protein-alanine N-acetyltransferase
VQIRGPELVLRYPDENDVDALFELGSDPEVVRFFSWGPYREPGEALYFVERLARERVSGERLEFVIASRSSGQVLGLTGLSEFSARDRRAVIGTWLGRSHWGTGVNAASKELLLAFAFETLGLLRVSAYANPANARSVAALERLGFAREGVLRSFHLHRGEPRDVAVLSLLRDEWSAGALAEVDVDVVGDPPPAFPRSSVQSD